MSSPLQRLLTAPLSQRIVGSLKDPLPKTGGGGGISLPPLPAGFAYVTDKDGNFITWKQTVYSAPAYLTARIN